MFPAPAGIPAFVVVVVVVLVVVDGAVFDAVVVAFATTANANTETELKMILPNINPPLGWVGFYRTRKA